VLYANDQWRPDYRVHADAYDGASRSAIAIR
jgi:hypothetical protein